VKKLCLSVKDVVESSKQFIIKLFALLINVREYIGGLGKHALRPLISKENQKKTHQKNSSPFYNLLEHNINSFLGGCYGDGRD
jgi:hypothetical protein